MCFWAKVVLHFVKLVLSMLQNLLRLWRVVFASFQFSLFCLTIFLVDGLKIKMVAGRCRATAGRRHVDRKCAVVALVKGGHTTASLKSLLASSPFWNSPFWFLLFQIFTLFLSHGVNRELLGGLSLLEWKSLLSLKDCLLTLLWTTTQKLHSFTSSWFSVFDGSSRLNQWLGQLGWQKVTLHSN